MSNIIATIDATVPSNTSVSLTLYEDVYGDGDGPNVDPNGIRFDNSNQISVQNGTNTYALSGFDVHPGNDYWTHTQFSTSNETASPRIHSIQIVPASQEDAGSVTQSTTLTRPQRIIDSGSTAHITHQILPRVKNTYWETAADWDNNQLDDGVAHPDALVYPAGALWDFDSATVGEVHPSWNIERSNGVVDNSRGYSDGQSMAYTSDISDPGTGVYVLGYTEDFRTSNYNEFRWKYWETTNQHGICVRLLDDNGNVVCITGTDNPQVHASDGTNNYEIINPSYKIWAEFVLTFDWANNTYDITWKDHSSGYSDQNVSGYSFWNGNASNIARIEVVLVDGNGYGQDGALHAWLDDFQVGSGSTNPRFITEKKSPAGDV